MFNLTDIIYCDFDGTVTRKDALNAFLSKFAHTSWLDIEQDWHDGKIGSKICMEKQIKLIKNMNKSTLMKFLDSIEIDPYFSAFVKYVESKGKSVVILSDGFDIFISYALKKAGLNHIKFYSNKVTVTENNGKLNFKLDFPYHNNKCDMSLGVCKCNVVPENKPFIYVGDGLSDRCIAKKAQTLFAKNILGGLKEHCLKNNLQFIEYNDFSDILNYIKEDKNICKV